MDQQVFLIFVSFLIINVGLAFFLVHTLSRRPLTPIARSLVVLIAAASLWSFGYFMEFISPTLEAKLLWARFQYFGVTMIPIAWFSFSYRRLGLPGFLGRPIMQKMALVAIPLLTLALVWTNDLHGLVWRDVQLQPMGAFKILEVHYGPGFWVWLAYGYSLILAGSFRLVGSLLTSFESGRWRSILQLLAVLIPWFGNLVYVTRLNPIPHLDWSSFAFTISGLLFLISLRQSSLIDILPIAQRKAFADLPDCLLVLDPQDRLVDMNAAALRALGLAGAAWRGKLLAMVDPELVGWVSQAGFQAEFRAEIARGDAPNRQFHDLQVVPLAGPGGRLVGRLLVCHDITSYKRTQVELEQARDRLKEAVAQRTVELSKAVSQLQAELARRTLAEKRFADIVESAPDAMLVIHQTGTVILVNAQAEELFGYSREELLGQHFGILSAEDVREEYRASVERFVADFSSEQASIGHVIASAALSVRRKDGSLFPAEINLGALKTQDGFWIACIIRDVSERLKAEREQKRLLAEIRQSQEELRALATRLAEAQEQEQRRIAIELHDRVGQNLTALNLNLQVIQSRLVPAENFRPARGRMEDSMRLLEETTRQVRNVMAELDPPLLGEYGLQAALRYACEAFMNRTGIDTELLGEEFTPRLGQREEMALFRIIQEGLNNAARHARATQVWVRMEADGPVARLSVEDNGQGFRQEDRQRGGRPPHWGLLSMQERAASIGGAVQIHSTPGQGTRLQITVPRGVTND